MVGKGIYQKLEFFSDILKIFQFRDFMSNFQEMAEIWQISAVWKLLKYEHIINNFEACDQEI